MKKIIELKLSKIRSAQNKMETVHLYHLTAEWTKLRTQEMILEEVLHDAELLEPKPIN